MSKDNDEQVQPGDVREEIDDQLTPEQMESAAGGVAIGPSRETTVKKTNWALPCWIT